ncbi:MAG TPA: STAS domain-containing protein [Gemmatimonadales bacterium]|jgi:anti-anti-sigma factor|nr:STAS domain-containing protein [Gemmatimonadales bacterium]HRZ10289.1 STAS domain-containing protein [Gemmatimonadales bacterium]
MAFTTSKHPSGVLIVEVEGQLIVGNRQELKATIQQALDNGERKLLVDFAKTGYIDSSGLGALVSISKKVREQGGELRLSGLNEDLRSLFELTKLDTLFAIADSSAQALAGF